MLHNVNHLCFYSTIPSQSHGIHFIYAPNNFHIYMDICPLNAGNDELGLVFIWPYTDMIDPVLTTRLLRWLYILQWRHNERDSVSNHWRLHCLLNWWFRRRSKKTTKLRFTGLCDGNSMVTVEFPAQKARNAANVLPSFQLWSVRCSHNHLLNTWINHEQESSPWNRPD